MGGYAGDVNGLWFVDVEIDGDGERGAVDVGFGGGGRPRLGGVAVWRRVQTLGQTLTRYVRVCIWEGDGGPGISHSSLTHHHQSPKIAELTARSHRCPSPGEGRFGGSSSWAGFTRGERH